MDYLRQTPKSSRWNYRRRVPKDVQVSYGREWVEQSLGTADKREARRRATIITAKLEEAWDALRGQATPLQRWRQGQDWLASQEPLPFTGEPDDDAAHWASDEFDRVEEGTAKLPQGATHDGYVAYLRGQQVVQRPRVTLREALKVWLDEQKPTESVKRGATRVVEQFMLMTGDVPMEAITRGQARQYRDSLVATGAMPGTITTYLSYLGTAFKTALDEALIDDRTNPFASLKVQRDKAPEEDREPIPRAACLALLKQSLEHGYDQADWFTAVMLTTGMRPIEAYGAKLVADAPIPYWAVPRAKKSPPRKVPVHPLLIGKQPVKFTVRPEQLRRHFIDRHKPFTAYQCRHSWKDEAVKAGTPMEMRMQLMGHSRRKAIGDQGVYGSSGVDLEEAAKWVEKMWE
jgi:integrase